MFLYGKFSFSNKKQAKFFFDLEKCFTFAELISTNKKIIRKSIIKGIEDGGIKIRIEGIKNGRLEPR